jgi:hypothetical protein
MVINNTKFVFLVQPNSDNTDRFYLSVDMLTKANALCDAMLSAPSPTTTSSVDTQKIQQGMVGYCFLIRAALNKSIDVVPSEQNQDKFNLSVDVITKTDALCGAMLTPPPPQKGLFGYLHARLLKCGRNRKRQH